MNAGLSRKPADGLMAEKGGGSIPAARPAGNLPCSRLLARYGTL
jgi:hypothetical protein